MALRREPQCTRKTRDNRFVEREAWFYEEETGLFFATDQTTFFVPVWQLKRYLERLEQNGG